MKLRIALFTILVLMFIMLPAVYGYSDPVSIVLIWQFLASALVGFLIFFKRIKFWFQNKFIKSKKED